MFFAFGDASWAVQELIMGIEVPFPSVSDVGYLAAYPTVFLGLILMPQAPATGSRRGKLTLDAFIAMASVAVVSWNFVISPLLGAGQGSTLADAVGVAYPFADLGIVFAVLILIARARSKSSTSHFLLLGAAFAVTAFSDSLYTYLVQVGDYSTGNYIDIGWLTGYNFVTIAALVAIGLRDADQPSHDGQPTAFWQSATLYLVAVPMAVLLVLESPSFLTAGVLAVVALMFIRQLLTIHENLALNRQLAELTTDLEVRVKTQALQLLRSRGVSENTSTLSRETAEAAFRADRG